MSKKKSEPDLPPIYFDIRSGGFLMELLPGRFVPMSGSYIKNHLQLDGINTEIKNDEGLSWGDEVLTEARKKNLVDYAGPLAGYKAGMKTTQGGERILVTKSVNVPTPGKSKKIPWIENFISELIPGGQLLYFISWWKIAYESLCDGDNTPGQLLGLVGEGGCGKTFLQWCITMSFGGRSARPYQYMTGKTPFNEDLAMAEHLVMGDEEASYDIRSRKKFAAQIKQFCVEPLMRVHGKGKLAFTVETFRRLSAGVNNEPEHMLFFPPFDGDMKPKIMLFKCSPAKLDRDREKNQKRFLEELPNLAAFLRDYEIPKSIRDDRFGVKAYQHPELLQIVEESTPEIQLLSLIDEIIFAKAKNDAPWRGSAEELKVTLLDSKHASTIYELLKFPSACGWYLARLKQKYPTRIEQRRSNGKSSWLIKKEQ